jgi:hypothetical protein
MTAIACLAIAIAAPPESLDAWAGEWTGTLELHSDKIKDVPMTLTIGASKDGKYPWKTVYDTGAGQKQVKDYEIIPSKEKVGWLEIDEKNGVKLVGKKTGSTMRFTYQVGVQLFDTRYTKTEKGILFELNMADMGNPQVTKAGGVPFSVLSYPPLATQTAELVKK